MGKTKETIGALATVDLSHTEKDMFVKYFEGSRQDSLIKYLDYLLGEDELLVFLDVFSRKTIKCPSREWVTRAINNIRIYLYIEAHIDRDGKIPEEVYKELTAKFRKRRSSIRYIYDKTKEILCNKEHGDTPDTPRSSSSSKYVKIED